LAAEGLALKNRGDIDQQTISGAISTGTHGTGARFGGMATQVRELRLVLADGNKIICSPATHSDIFAAARVGLGALGVITEVTLQCVPAFRLRAVEGPASLDEVLASFDAAVAEHDHFDLYWFPHTDRALTKHNDRVPGHHEGRPLPRWRYALDDELLSNRLFEVANRLGGLRPVLVPQINQISARALAAREFTDASYAVFNTPRRVRFVESEYAVPRPSLLPVLRSLRAWLDDHDERIVFPVEVRVAAADEIWLSTGYRRDNAYVAIHQYHRLDPGRTFGNDYLTRVLGP
jgi:L-gulonolactone oxidase